MEADTFIAAAATAALALVIAVAFGRQWTPGWSSIVRMVCGRPAEVDPASEGRVGVRAPASAATLQRLVTLIAEHEPDLRDLLLGLCQRRMDEVWHVAASKDELPPHPEGPKKDRLGRLTFAVTVPKGGFFRTTTMKRQAFAGCSSLAEIALPPNLTEIGEFAFQGCTSLSEITLPPNLTEIRASTFQWCTSLSEITLPPDLTKIENGAFLWCSSLAEITLPPTLAEIGASAFSFCTSLTKITLPPNLAKIGDGAFNNCSSLAEITLPPGHVTIGDHAFLRCPGTPRRN